MELFLNIYNYVNEIFQSFKGLIIGLSLFVFITWMQSYIRKPLLYMFKRKEELQTKLEDRLEEKETNYWKNVDEDFNPRKSYSEFQDELDRLKQDYQQRIRDVQDNFNSSTLMEILILIATGLGIVSFYVIFQLVS